MGYLDQYKWLLRLIQTVTYLNTNDYLPQYKPLLGSIQMITYLFQV